MKKSLFLASLLLFSVSSGADDSKYTYEIIKENSTPSVKRSLDISLDKKITKEELTDLATKLKGSTEYESTFIGYVINKSEVKNGYWATTHFTPDLEVKILGLTLDQEKERKSIESPDDGKQIVSKWVDDRPYIGATLTIYEKNGSTYLESVYPDNSSSNEEVKISKGKQRRKVETVEENGFGEYFVINNEGSLEFWSSNGNYYTAKKLD